MAGVLRGAAALATRLSGLVSCRDSEGPRLSAAEANAHWRGLLGGAPCSCPLCRPRAMSARPEEREEEEDYSEDACDDGLEVGGFCDDGSDDDF